MREIKFRAWDSACNGYADKWKLYLDGGVSIEGTWATSDVILEQYTGLKDKNGAEIYEGDIVTCAMGYKEGSLPHRGEIVYVEEFGAFATKNQAGETLLQNHHTNSFEVIGNIHQNGELLK